MKRRIHRVINFFAFNLLFFALYLNFIHKDTSSSLGGQTSQQSDETLVVKKQESTTQKPSVASAATVNVSVK